MLKIPLKLAAKYVVNHKGIFYQRLGQKKWSKEVIFERRIQFNAVKSLN